ncbi:hypothetical protein ACW0JT_11560 [Arthrobacter sp. SA17]
MQDGVFGRAAGDWVQDVKGKARRVVSANKSGLMAGKRGSVPSIVLRTVLLTTSVALTVAGCSLGVPDPAAPKVVPTTPGVATPTITPGYDAAAVAAKDMPFAAGDTLPAGVPVGISDGLAQAPGWKPGKQGVAGENQYIKADGCVVAAKVRTNQWPLTSSGNDKTSTIELFTYLDSTILPDYLTPANLRWGGNRTSPLPTWRSWFLKGAHFRGQGYVDNGEDVRQNRLIRLYLHFLSGPGALAAAKADVAQRVAVVPPSN